MRDPKTVALIVALALIQPAAAAAQPSLAGVITLVRGPVTVVRPSASEPLPLQLRDGIFVEDTIATGENGFARVLLGGKAVVTMRERSTVQIFEDGSTSTIVVGEGKIAVAVARELAKTGELIEIRTPTALATSHGAVVIAGVTPDRSMFTVLRGLVDVTRIEPLGRRAVGPRVMLRGNQELTVPTPGLLRPQRVNPRAIERLAADFDVETVAGIADSAPATEKRPPSPASKRRP